MQKNGELSNNALSVVLILAIAISVAGTMMSWNKLHATSTTSLADVTGAVSSGTGTVTSTITNTTAITIHQSPVAFGSMSSGTQDDTTDGTPVAFQINNTGNVPLNVTVNASALFSGASTNSSSYQFSCGADEGPNCPTGSATSATNMPLANATGLNETAIYDFPAANGNDSREVEIYVSIPTDEPGGAKTSTVTFQATQI